MFRIGKTFRFEAGHSLPRLPDGHKCKRPHGHSYQVEVIIESRLRNEYDFVMDYAELDDFKIKLMKEYDHRELNEVLKEYYGGFETPTTAEALAKHFHSIVMQLYRVKLRGKNLTVRVKETESTFAEYYE